MADGGKITNAVNLDKVQSDVAKLWRLVNNQPSISKSQKAAIKSLYRDVVRSLGRSAEPTPRSATRSRRSSSQFLRPNVPEPTSVQESKLPFLHLKRKSGQSWAYSQKLTNIYFDVLTEIATAGTTFAKKAALMTGVGKGSIGVEVLKDCWLVVQPLSLPPRDTLGKRSTTTRTSSTNSVPRVPSSWLYPSTVLPSRMLKPW